MSIININLNFFNYPGTQALRSLNTAVVGLDQRGEIWGWDCGRGRGSYVFGWEYIETDGGRGYGWVDLQENEEGGQGRTWPFSQE